MSVNTKFVALPYHCSLSNVTRSRPVKLVAIICWPLANATFLVNQMTPHKILQKRVNNNKIPTSPYYCDDYYSKTPIIGVEKAAVES